MFISPFVLKDEHLKSRSDKVKFPGKEMDAHSLCGQVHLTKSNFSLTTISSALAKRTSNPLHVFCRQDVGASLDEGKKAGGTDRKREVGLDRGQ